MRIRKTRVNESVYVPWAGRQVPPVRCWITVIRRVAASAALVLLWLALSSLSNTYGQETESHEIQSRVAANVEGCPAEARLTSGSHGFRRVGETIDIPINVGDCEPVAFMLRWSNGRSNGTSLVVTFLDSTNQPIHSRSLSGFLTGSFEFPFASLDQQPWFARGSIVAVPTTVVIQALAPFYPPANISYTVTRRAGRVRARPPTEFQAVTQPAALSKSQPTSTTVPTLDHQLAMRLRTVEGRLLSQGQSSWVSESTELVRYKLKELVLPGPRELTIHGRRETVDVAYRLTLASGDLRGPRGAEELSNFGLIWLDDAPLPTFSTTSQEISTLIYDASVLKDGAEIAVSSVDGSDMHSLVERLRYQSRVQGLKTNQETNAQILTSDHHSSEEVGEKNEVVAIRNGIRVVGATRMPLVQIDLRTNRPFPATEKALLLQIGKRFFLDELTGDHTGRKLTVTLTQDMFAELRQGAEIVAFFDKPDRTGFSRDVWHFGRLDKGRRH